MAPPRHVWSLPLARVTAGATLVLIMAGGLVTTTGAGLAVPDWPTTFGENLFLFPWSRMVGGVLVEHSHRLLGVVVGGLTLGLGAAVWLEDRRDWARGLAGEAAVDQGQDIPDEHDAEPADQSLDRPVLAEVDVGQRLDLRRHAIG